jgi:hypothetical protein
MCPLMVVAARYLAMDGPSCLQSMRRDRMVGDGKFLMEAGMESLPPSISACLVHGTEKSLFCLHSPSSGAMIFEVAEIYASPKGNRCRLAFPGCHNLQVSVGASASPRGARPLGRIAVQAPVPNVIVPPTSPQIQNTRLRAIVIGCLDDMIPLQPAGGPGVVIAA